MDEKRFIFISYIEIAKYLKGKDETALKNTIDGMISQCSEFGFTDIILQVRSFSDAIYYSDIYLKTFNQSNRLLFSIHIGDSLLITSM